MVGRLFFLIFLAFLSFSSVQGYGLGASPDKVTLSNGGKQQIHLFNPDNEKVTVSATNTCDNAALQADVVVINQKSVKSVMLTAGKIATSEDCFLIFRPQSSGQQGIGILPSVSVKVRINGVLIQQPNEKKSDVLGPILTLSIITSGLVVFYLVRKI